MKITHNKVGQNLNMAVDGVKQDKTQGAKGVKETSKLPDFAQTGGTAAKVDVSERAQEAKRIKELAMAAPDVDVEKVNKFQKMIDEGKYKVDSRAVADKMVDEHLETSN